MNLELLLLKLFLFIFFLIFGFSIVMLIRNHWGYKKLMRLNRFENGIHIIKQYSDYDQIFFKFWIWDIEKFKKK